MFVKIATWITLMCTSLTWVAVVSAEPWDALYPVKVEVKETIETTFENESDTSAEFESEWTTETSSSNDSYLNINSTFTVN
jgi:hypothetical protein